MAGFSEIIKSKKVVLIDFYADWCGPCKVLSPIIQDVKNEVGEDVKIVKIDVDKNESLSQKLNVSGIPTIMMYRDGELFWRESGVQTKHAILSKIAEALQD